MSRVAGSWNPAVRALRCADAVLDVTGGDSFTDLYGMKRFKSGAAAKQLALDHSGGLVLLPQTYGPFADDGARREAARLVGSAEAAWARDPASFDVLRALLGRKFDPARHGSGVDMAFGLPVSPPRGLAPELAYWLGPSREEPVVGVNVSGLTWVKAADARRDYSLAADYRATVLAIVDRLLSRTNARIVLVPHVLTPPDHFESDATAARQLSHAFGARAHGRMLVAPEMSASEAKGLIAKTDWFCGTRMHSAIAALSSGVPCAALAYSGKTRGVFATCGLEEHVADLRKLDAIPAADVVWRSYEERDDARARLAESLPRVLGTARRQMDEIVAACHRLAESRGACAIS